jgi:hypothetical protein
MGNVHNRLTKIEKKLNIADENQIITFMGIKMTMGSFTKMIRDIDPKNKGRLPTIEETKYE